MSVVVERFFCFRRVREKNDVVRYAILQIVSKFNIDV